MFPHEQIGLPFPAARTDVAAMDLESEKLPQRAAEAVLQHLRQQVRDGAVEGVRCPCCDRLVRAYRRPLGADMARFLILLCRAYLAGPPGEWVDVRAIPARGGDYAKLAHWGLIEQAPNDDPARRSSGLWRPTPAGMAFAEGRTREPSHVFLLDNRRIGAEDATVDVYEALGRRFDFAELWGRTIAG
jgi:hypothetical protein